MNKTSVHASEAIRQDDETARILEAHESGSQESNPKKRGRPRSTQTDDNGFPLDWMQTLSYHGVTRSNAHKAYYVRLSVQGQQIFITETRTQESAARAYDYALWLFLPKLGHMRSANFPDDFAFITQRRLEEAMPTRCGALMRKYESLSYPDSRHETMSDEELREAILFSPAEGVASKSPQSPRGMKRYNDVAFRMARLRIDLESHLLSVETSRLSLAHVHKLPALRQQFIDAHGDLKKALQTIHVLTDLLDSQRNFYSTLVTQPTE